MTLQLTALCFFSHSDPLVFIPIQGVGEGEIGMAVAPLDNGGAAFGTPPWVLEAFGCWPHPDSKAILFSSWSA